MSTRQPELAQYTAILFDLDGTLIETDNRWAEVLAEKLKWLKRLFPRLDTVTLAHWVVTSIEMPGNYAISALEHLKLNRLLDGIANRVRKSKGLATSDEHEMVPGSMDLLVALQGRYPMAVVTTRARKEAYAFIEAMGFARFFPVIITRQDVLQMKPHPSPIRKAAEALGVAPEHCIMVGDTVMDMRSARRAGAYAVGVLSGFGTRRELGRGGAQLLLDYAVELLPLLD